MLQIMKTRLMQQDIGPSDRIWSVHWTLRCSIPVLNEMIQEDLAVAVAIELDELKRGNKTIRLLHNVKLVPNAWKLEDNKHLAQRYGVIVNNMDQLQESSLQEMIEDDSELTVGWRHRLNALISGIDAEQVLARMRVDGAEWFIPDLSELDAIAAGDTDSNGLNASKRLNAGESGVDEHDEEFSEDDAVDVLMESTEQDDGSLYEDDQYDSESDDDADDAEGDAA